MHTHRKSQLAASAFFIWVLFPFVAAGAIPKKLQIVLESSEKGLVGEWDDVCEALGNSLQVGKGAFGLGVFTEYECHDGWSQASKKQGAWFLQVQIGNKSTKVALYRTVQDARRNAQEIAWFRFNEVRRALAALAEPDISLMVGYLLLDQMPAMLRVTSQNLTSGGFRGTDPPEIDTLVVPRPPARLMLYTLKYEQARQVWVPQVLGYGQNIHHDEKKSRLHQKVQNVAPFWQVERQISGAGDVFAHDDRGRRTRQADLKTELTTRIDAYVNTINAGVVATAAAAIRAFFTNMGTAGYLGVRYGLPLLPGEVISKSTFVGALAEIRSGIFDGLKVYFDYWPEVTDEVAGGEGSFGGQRAILGYSLSLGFDSIITSIDLTPKAGIWTFGAKFPFASEADESQFDTLEFKVNNAPSLELELGVESATYWYILRAWASRALSYRLSQTQAGVVNSRAGFDLMIRGPSFDESGDVNFSFLVFAFSEKL